MEYRAAGIRRGRSEDPLPTDNLLGMPVRPQAKSLGRMPVPGRPVAERVGVEQRSCLRHLTGVRRLLSKAGL